MTKAIRFITPKDDYFEWLFIMQHHGTPTRLLDWSENAMVAIAFATQYRKDKHKDKDAVVWCLNPVEFNSNVRFRTYSEEPIPNICEEKDVDGFRRDSFFKPCTPKGIMDWLDFNNYDLEGKNITVIGRSKIVGKPLVNLLIDRGATVTCCNSKTKDLRQHTCNADVVISAVGKPKFLDSSYFTNTELVIDVGINRDENDKLCGDVDHEEVTSTLKNIYVTPVPKGVGRLTTLALVENTIKAYKEKQRIYSL